MEIRENGDSYSIIGDNNRKIAHVHKKRENLELHMDRKKHKHIQVIKLKATEEIVLVYGKKKISSDEELLYEE